MIPIRFKRVLFVVKMYLCFYADTQYLLNQSQTIANISNWSVNNNCHIKVFVWISVIKIPTGCTRSTQNTGLFTRLTLMSDNS